MNRLKRIAAIALLLALLPTALTLASPPINAIGDIYDEEGSFVSLEPQGNKCILTMDVQFRMEGTIEATCIEAFQTTVHAPCTDLPGGPGEVKEKWVMHAQCAGMVEDRTGSFTFDGVAHINPDKEPIGRGRAVLHGTGGNLSSLHGVLALSPNPPIGGTYEGFVHFSKP